MNSFGTFFRISIYGESHGDEVGIIVDGCPPGISLAVEDFKQDLDRRRGGVLKGTTPRSETDTPVIRSGIFNGHSTGAPILIAFENTNIRTADYENLRAIPRPGHADWVAHYKFAGFEDYRGAGHFSGRLTVCLVAAGVIAKKILSQAYPSLQFSGVLTELGGSSDLEAGLQKAIDAKDSVGGIVSCSVSGIPPGLGEPFFDSAESLISHLVFSIPAVRGIEFGTGFKAASMFGSEHNDPIIDPQGITETNHAGGVVGGISNGNELIFRVAIKPASSTPKSQHSYSYESRMVENFSIRGRHDLAIALRVPVILESVTAIVLADLLFRK
jgi:chorismate synthase